MPRRFRLRRPAPIRWRRHTARLMDSRFPKCRRRHWRGRRRTLFRIGIADAKRLAKLRRELRLAAQLGAQRMGRGIFYNAATDIFYIYSHASKMMHGCKGGNQP